MTMTPIQTLPQPAAQPSSEPQPQETKKSFGSTMLGALGCFALGAWIYYDLTRLEAGLVDGVRVWAPIATVYNFFGYWPSVVILPLLGIALTVMAVCTLFDEAPTSFRGGNAPKPARDL
jgi:hypothetical protein